MLNFDPPHVMISAGAHPDKNRLKDTVWNIEQTGEFVFNMATYDLREEVNLSSNFVGPDVDEMAMAGLPQRLRNGEATPCRRIAGAYGMPLVSPPSPYPPTSLAITAAW